jgi:hypothetical protein
MEGQQPRSGWYPNPDGSGTERYWDGDEWTTEVRPLGSTQQARAERSSAGLGGSSGRRSGRGLAEFLDGLDELYPGYAFFADRIRGGVSRADQDRLGDDGQVHRLVRGDFAGTVSVATHGRRAHFDRPAGWEEFSPADLAALNAATGGGAFFAQLHRPDSEATDVYSIGFVTGDPGLARMNPVLWALWSEGNLGLPATRMRRVQFGNGVGFLWHHEGAVEGWMLGRPQQHMILVHTAEMWSASPPGPVRIALAAPPGQIEEAWAGFNTVIASWVWD